MGVQVSDTRKPHNQAFLRSPERHPGLALAVAGVLTVDWSPF